MVTNSIFHVSIKIMLLYIMQIVCFNCSYGKNYTTFMFLGLKNSYTCTGYLLFVLLNNLICC